MSGKIDGQSSVITGFNTSGTGGPVEVKEKTGQGVSGTNGDAQTPPPPTTFGLIVASLRNFAPGNPGSDFEAKLADITAKLRDVSGEVETDRVQNEQEIKRVNMKENEAKIKEAEKKLEEAEAKRKSGNIFDIIAMAFQALGALLLMAIGALLQAVPGAQALGAMMIVAGVMLAVSLVNSIVAKANDGAGILGSIAKAAGASPEVIMGLDIAFTAAMLIASIAMAVFTGGSSAAAEIAGMAGKVAQAMQAAAKIVEIGTNVGSAVANVGGSAYRVAAAVDSKDAANLRAESDEIQALMQQLDDLIDQALQMLQQAAQRFNAIADTMTEMLNETGDTVSSTRFTD